MVRLSKFWCASNRQFISEQRLVVDNDMTREKKERLLAPSASENLKVKWAWEWTPVQSFFKIWVTNLYEKNARGVKLPWIFPVAPLTFNMAPGNIQGNLDRYATRFAA